MWLTWWLRCVLLCPYFLHMWFSEKEHHLQEEKSFRMQTIWEYRSLCFEKLLQYVEASPAWHAEDIAPLPESEFSLSCPVTGTSFGGQAALGAHSQMGSRWNFSPFLSFFPKMIYFQPLSIMLNRSGQSGPPVLFLILRGKVFNLSPLIMILTVGFCRCPLSG